MGMNSTFYKTYKITFIILLFLGLPFSNFSYVCAADDQSFILIKKARDHINLFQYQQAINALKEAIKINSENWEAWYTVGLAYHRMKKESDAEKAFSKALELNPEEQDIQKALGAIYVVRAKNAQNRGNTAEMTEQMLKACKAYPSGTKIWASLFQIWWENGEYIKIKNEADFLISKNRKGLEEAFDESLQEAIIIVAKTYYRENNIEQTENYLKYANAIRVHNDGLYLLKRELKTKYDAEIKKLIDTAEIHYAKEEFNEAIEVYKKISKLPGDKPFDILEKIEIVEKDKLYFETMSMVEKMLKNKEYEKALDALVAASEKFPDEAEISEIYEETKALYDEELAKKDRIIQIEAMKKRKAQESLQRYRKYLAEADKFEKDLNFVAAIDSIKSALKEQMADSAKLNERIIQLEGKKIEYENRAEEFRKKFAEVERANYKKEYETAFNLSQKLLIAYPEKRQELLPTVAELAVKTGNSTEGKRLAEEFKDSDEILYNYISAFAAYELGEYETALAFFDKVKFKKFDFRNDINTTIFKIYIKQYSMYMFFALIAIALLLSKKFVLFLKNYKVKLLLKKVEKIREKGDYEKHLAFLEEHYMKEDLPDMRTITLLLSGALLKTGAPQRAYDLANNLLKREGKNPLARKIAGEACMLLNDMSPQALEHIQNLYKLDESRKDIVIYLAQAFMTNQVDHKTAQDFLSQAITLSPNDNEILFYLANVYINRQIYNTQTIKVFDRAIRLAPDDPKYYKALIENYKKTNDSQNAEKWSILASEKFSDELLSDQNITPTAFNTIPQQNFYSQQFSKTFEPIPVPKPATTETYPDYDSIGNAPTQEQRGFTAFPDYENIEGNDEKMDGDPAILIDNPFALPPVDNLPAVDNLPSIDALPTFGSPQTKPTNTFESQISGPQRNCPHCNEANSIKEYYCSKCGKPLG
jgi:tetratricopeptide (TPR) repeat protein